LDTSEEYNPGWVRRWINNNHYLVKKDYAILDDHTNLIKSLEDNCSKGNKHNNLTPN
tara:strand:- start:277 stop:447 length:171 start_codon:yes stop_codon:yes gene_type:complete